MVLCVVDKNKKKCPFCKKAIAIDATVCPYCNKELSRNKSSLENDRWISQRIVGLIAEGKSATDAKIQAEAEYLTSRSRPADVTDDVQ